MLEKCDKLDPFVLLLRFTHLKDRHSIPLLSLLFLLSLIRTYYRAYSLHYLRVILYKGSHRGFTNKVSPSLLLKGLGIEIFCCKIFIHKFSSWSRR